MALVDSKDAEKEYLSRAGGGAWERAKPFSHPCADTIRESAGLLHDFAVAMLTLQPEPEDLILDLGSGGCWCSDLLSKLNRRSVALDISWEMLRAGRSRPAGAGIVAVSGDMERLPFRTGSFSKTLCLNAIHHVRDISASVREIARVLRADGVAYFSEPGLGHAADPRSVAAVRDFGVLEQDIVIDAFARQCREAGFSSVRLKAMSYAVPDFDLSPEEFQAWSRLASSKRPVRAIGKILRAAVELIGLGKRSTLFEEAFAMKLVRRLKPLIEEHPVIVAAKATSALGLRTYRAGIGIDHLSDRIKRGESVRGKLTLSNLGDKGWPATTPSGVGHVQVGVQLLDGSSRLLSRDYTRIALPREIPPGDHLSVILDFPGPREPGAYQLRFDLVAEGIAWFGSEGSETSTRNLRVD